MKQILLIAIIFIGNMANAQDFAWAGSIPGTSSTDLHEIAVDAYGNTFVSGTFKGTVDFDMGEGNVSLTSASPSFADIYIAKYNGSGMLLWAKKINGNPTSLMYFRAITLDSTGNVLITGTFSFDADFDPGDGVFNLSAIGMGISNIFILKLDANGNFIWVRNFGGTDGIQGNDIVSDPFGNIYTVGFLSGTIDFDPSESEYNLSTFGSYDAFVCKLDAAGNFLWARQLGGTSYDTGMSVGVDAAGNVFSVGEYYGTADFNPGPETFNLTPDASGRDIYISKLDADGNFVWAKQTGRYPSSEPQNPIVVDAAGNFYIAGRYGNTIDFDLTDGVYNQTSIGNWDMFVAKMDTDANLIWAKSFGGVAMDYINSLAVDNSGNVYTTGYFQGIADFDPSGAVVSLTSFGQNDIFVAKLDPSGNFGWARQMGGTGEDFGRSVLTDYFGNVYSSGVFRNVADLNSDSETLPFTASNFFGDIYLHKISNNNLGASSENNSNEIAVYPNPTDGTYFIRGTGLAGSIVSVYDMMGRKVSEIAAEQDLVSGQLDHGVYVIKIVNGNRSETKKLIVR